MRQIKFRAWDKEVNRMLFPTSTIAFVLLYNGFARVESNLKCYPEGDFEFMQFTGLTDTDGKEIYEGDVVEWNIYPDDSKSGITSPKRIRDVVSFGMGCFKVEKRGEILGLKEPHRRLRVIGNIYENPELLTKAV